MLPSEAVLLTHPVLRTLWYARQAERALLTYHARGVFTERIQATQTFDDGVETAHVRAERGPILVVFDTSGSMTWTFPNSFMDRESIAKAVLLQMLSVAFMEDRPCFVYVFSGPGDLAEHELTFDGEGITRVLAFMSLSFHGGTVPDEALKRACRRLNQSDWCQGDLVVISDGEFELERSTKVVIQKAKQRHDMRIHGVRVGQGEGFDQIGCHMIHNVWEWFDDLIAPREDPYSC
jgi:uncharacterized protein with von Willebrand factor type A (vWA) domain